MHKSLFLSIAVFFYLNFLKKIVGVYRAVHLTRYELVELRKSVQVSDLWSGMQPIYFHSILFAAGGRRKYQPGHSSNDLNDSRARRTKVIKIYSRNLFSLHVHAIT